jgi:hypothetical protein
MTGMVQNIRTVVTTDPNKLEAQAKDAMNHQPFCYVAGGAGERSTMDANRLAFRQWKVCKLLNLLFELAVSFLTRAMKRKRKRTMRFSSSTCWANTRDSY